MSKQHLASAANISSEVLVFHKPSECHHLYILHEPFNDASKMTLIYYMNINMYT